MRLFRKRTIWLPTWPVVLVGFLVAASLVCFLFFSSNHFLAVTKPAAGATVMVVEAWVSDTSMEKVAEILNAPASPYSEVWLVGPTIAYGYHLSDRYKTFSEMGAATLKVLGVPAEKIHVVSAPKSETHRTYSSGAKFRADLDEQGIGIERFDLVTLDVHARRSRLVYQKLFPDAEVGIIALPPAGYTSDRWYKTSSGMKNTIFEIVAYLYEKLADGGR